MGWAYTAGTLTYLFKNFAETYVERGSLEPLLTETAYSTSMDVTGAVLNIISNYYYRRAAENPEQMRIGGYWGLAGTFFFAASGVGGEAPVTHALSMLPTAIGILLLALDDRTGGTQLEGRYDKRFFAGIGEFIGRPFHFWAGWQQGDIGQMVASVFWGTADTGSWLSSKTIRRLLGPDALPHEQQSEPAQAII